MEALDDLAHRIAAELQARFALPSPLLQPESPRPTRVATLPEAIEHTLLRPDATSADMERLCQEALRHRFAAVCVGSAFVEPCARTGVRVVSVVGFPLGTSATAAKVFEAKHAVASGAGEIDMVIALGALKARQDERVVQDIAAVVTAVEPVPVKVILEMGALVAEEKIAACLLTRIAGAAFVKTSTGFGPGGATVSDVALLARWAGDKMGVKASGGIRTRAQAEALLDAGAQRIGTSSGISIMAERE